MSARDLVLQREIWKRRCPALLARVDELEAALAALGKQAADAMSKESAKALIEEANRWQIAYNRERDGRVRAEKALRHIKRMRPDRGAKIERAVEIAAEALAAAGADTATKGNAVIVSQDDGEPKETFPRPSFCRAAISDPCISAECRCRETPTYGAATGADTA